MGDTLELLLLVFIACFYSKGRSETCIPTLPTFDEVASLAEPCSSSSPNGSNCSVGVADPAGSTFIFPELTFTCNASVLAWRVAGSGSLNKTTLQIWRKVDVFGYALSVQIPLQDCNGGLPDTITSNVYQCSLESSIDVVQEDIIGFLVVPASTSGLYFDLSEADPEELVGYQDLAKITSFPRDNRVPSKTIPRATPLLALKLKSADTPVGSTATTENAIATAETENRDKKFELVLGAEVIASVVVVAVILTIFSVLVIGLQCYVINKRWKKKWQTHSSQHPATPPQDIKEPPEAHTMFLESLTDHYEIVNADPKSSDQDEDSMHLHNNASYGSHLALAAPDLEPEYSSVKAKPEPMYDSASLAGSETEESTYSNPRVFTHMYSNTSLALSMSHGSASNNGSLIGLSMLSKSNRSLNMPTPPNIKAFPSSNSLHNSRVPEAANSDDSEPDYY